MALNRREFLGALLATGFSAHASSNDKSTNSWLYREDQKQGFSILQGMTDERSAQFSLVLPVGENLRMEVVEAQGGGAAFTYVHDVIARPYSPFEVHKLSVEGLQLGQQYLLRVLDASGVVRDEREFRALDLSPRSVRLGFVSCALDLLHRDDIWRRFDHVDPEAVLFLGDNVYADRTSFINKRPADEKQQWERYVATRNRVLFYFQKKLRPVIATWDDHDYGSDNAGSEFVHKEAALKTFEIFFAQSPRPSLVSGPGVSKRWSAFGADFFLLDGRYFRDNSGRAEPKLFGDEQEGWLFAGMQSRPAWLLNGTLFFGAYGDSDSFEGRFRANFDQWLQQIAARPSLVCFASGDVHFSEVMDIEEEKLGYKTFEVVSSSVHSYTFPGHDNRFVNPRRRVSTSGHNFVVFEGSFSSDGVAQKIEGEVISYAAAGVEFKTTVSVQR